MLIITDGTAPGTIPGGAPATITAGIHPGAIHMPGTTPGGMTPGTAGVGEIPSGMADGPGTIPGTHPAGILMPGVLTTDLTAADGIITVTTATTTITAHSLGAVAIRVTTTTITQAVRHTDAASPTAIIQAAA